MTASPCRLQRDYIDLVKRCVTNYPIAGGRTSFTEYNALDHYDEAAGRWRIPPAGVPLSVLSKGQLDLIETLSLGLERHAVPGDFIEAGVWRGGAVALMRALVKVYGYRDRLVVAADSFSGIPRSTDFRFDLVNDWPDRWCASLETVRGNIERLGLLDEGIEFLPGPFKDTLPGLTGRRFALVRLDADAYDSTMTALLHLYPLLSQGGCVIIDDWHLFGCKLAVETYRADHGVTDPIVLDSGNAYWIKRQPHGAPNRHDRTAARGQCAERRAAADGRGGASGTGQPRAGTSGEG